MTTLKQMIAAKDDLSEKTEELEHTNNSETNDSNREDLSVKIPSQESQSSRKLVVNASKNINGREKAKEFNCKK